MGLMGTYNRRLLKVVSRRRFWVTILGEVEDLPIWLVRTSMIYDKRKPHILIAAGFHGEEKAGPLAIMRWLESKPIPPKIDISFLPVVNPVAFNLQQRYNNQNQKSNAGFCHSELGDALSAEGQILMANEVNLRKLARDGFLSLHEDVTMKEFYIYQYEPGNDISDFARSLRDVEDRFFARYEDGSKVVTDGSSVLYPERNVVREGIVWNLCDGSYDDFRMHQGCKHSFATETPAKGIRISKRINANLAIIDKFVELVVQEFYE